ncbi:MAG: hypothetical protein QW165_04600 [Candidatus Woesearchaeota archaeon]
MEKIALALLVLIATVAFVGLVKLDTSTGQAYYTSYQYKTQTLVGRLLNAPPNAEFIIGVADTGVVGRGEIQGGIYKMTLSGAWRENLVIDLYINGDRYCSSVAVARILDPQRLLYTGQYVLDVWCA